MKTLLSKLFLVLLVLATISLSFSDSAAITDDCNAYPYYFCGNGYSEYEDDKCHYTYNWFYCEYDGNDCNGGHCGDHEEEEPL